ncbi:MAG: CpXC domain-containing protein [Spirochaetaceae bacterium]|nr:MAG: CpXC domain-containing protein [Spirochaetaceae bacterium]
MKRQIVCFCEHSFTTDVPDSVDLGKEPEVEQAIISGEFLNIRCPNCGKVLKPEFPVLIEDPQAENSIFFIPELDRGQYFRGTLAYSLREANRVAIGYEELVEKFLLKRSNLDDRVMEIVKYYLLSRIMEEDSGDKEVRILFSKAEGESAWFNVLGLKENEVGILKVPMETVHKVESQLEEKKHQEPFSDILKTPYVSINNLLTEGPD